MLVRSAFCRAPNTKMVSNCVYPCPCGYYGDSLKLCTCAPEMVTKYQKRISGPLLDCIDIHIEVPRVDYEKLSGDRMRGDQRVDSQAWVQAARYTTKMFRSQRRWYCINILPML